MTSGRSPKRRRSPGRRTLVVLVPLILLVGIGWAAYRTVRGTDDVILGSTTDFITTDDVTATSPPATPEDTGAWPDYGFNTRKTRHNPDLDNLRRPGTLRWEFDALSLVEFPPVIDDGIAVVGTNHRRIFALDVESGAVVWQTKTRGRIASSPAINDGVVYITDTDGWFGALNLKTGRRLWDMQIGTSSETSPTIIGNGVYVATLDDEVLRFTLDGKEVWRAPVYGDVKSAVAQYGDSIIVSDYAGRITSLSQKDGSELWSTESPSSGLGGAGRFYAGPAVSYGRVYVGNINGRVIALNARTGELAWLRTLDDWVYSSAAITDQTIFVGSYDHHLYALDAATGEIRWKFDAGERISGSASVIGNLVYVSTLNEDRTTGHTYALRITDGRLAWEFPDGRYSPAVAIRDTIMIIGRRKIYAFDPR